MNEPNKVYVSWDDIVKGLMQKVPTIAELPDIQTIVAIARGGLPVATLVSHLSNIRMIDTLCFRQYSKMEASPIEVLKAQRSLERVLLVDDVADTGSALKLAEFYYPNCVTLALHYKPHSTVKPDYYLWETSDWIVYPWEIGEDS